MIREDVRCSIDALDKNERAELEAYLRAKSLAEDSDYRREVELRTTQMREGQYVSASEMRRIHDMLSKQGI